jgi:hypothetical protein
MQSTWSEDLSELLNTEVVVDTGQEIIYLGTLTKVTESGLWLENSDVRDRREGHATKELYVVEAAIHGIRVNRLRVFVARPTVLSISALRDVVK